MPVAVINSRPSAIVITHHSLNAPDSPFVQSLFGEDYSGLLESRQILEKIGSSRTLARKRAGNAPVHVDQIRHDKDREQRRFGDDEKDDADGASVGELPLLLHRKRRWPRAYLRQPLLIKLPVWVLRVLQIPKRAAAAHNRQLFEIVFRRRRSGGPFEGPAVPGIVAGDFALSQEITTQ